MKKKNKIINKIIISIISMVAILTSISPVNAGYGGQGKVQGGASGDININISSQPLYFDDHRGMQASINGQPVFCIQRGYPFRSMVSELQMVNTKVNIGYGNLNYHDGTISSLLRYLLKDASSGTIEFFRGFGTWEMNSDSTDAVLISTDGAPTSLAWQEVFDEDTEDSEYKNRYQGTGKFN